MTSPSHLVRTFVPHLLAQKWRVVGAYTMSVAGVCLALAAPWPLKFLIDGVLTGSDAPPLLAGLSPQREVLVLAGLMLIVAALLAVTLSIERVMHARIRESFGLTLRDQLIQRVYSLSLGSRQSERSGELTMRLVSDSQLVSRLFCKTFPDLVKDAALASLLLCTTLIIDVRIGAIAVAMALALLFVLHRKAPEVTHAARRKRSLEGRVSAITQESVVAIEHIQSMALERQTRTRYLRELRSALVAGVDEVRASVQLERSAQLLSALAVALVAAVGGMLVLSGGLTLGTLTVCLAYISQLLKPIEKLNETAATISRGIVRAERLIDLLEAESAIPKPEFEQAIDRISEITCHDAGHIYADCATPAVGSFTYSFRRGECTALIGPSGCGKSTLIKLILRLIEPTSGHITVNDRIPYASVDPFSLRSQFAVLMQDARHFSGSLRDVVTELEPAASDARVMAVLADVELASMVTSMREGLDTPIDEAGARLSGGQLARLLLARALLAERSVLILDEPFANIDDHSKRIVLRALERAKASRILIVITHERSLLRIADHVVHASSWQFAAEPDIANAG